MADLQEFQLGKVLLFGTLILGGLGYAAHTYVYRPRAAEVEELEQRLGALETVNRSAQMLAEQNRPEDIERQLAAYREHLRHLERLVPASEEVPELLDGISIEARRTGVDLALIQPVSGAVEDYYTRQTYDLSVLGSYHEVGEFLTRIGSLPRIVTPVALSLTVWNEETRSGDPQLEARFSIETYVLPFNRTVTDAR